MFSTPIHVGVGLFLKGNNYFNNLKYWEEIEILRCFYAVSPMVLPAAVTEPHVLQPYFLKNPKHSKALQQRCTEIILEK